MALTEILLLAASTAIAVDAAGLAADGGHFSNNLLSDLGPLLERFGEQFVNQFLIYSLYWLDALICAMAPLEILTAVVLAIGMSGPPSPIALIGRARTSRVTAEIELMTCTSQEICELWDGV